MRDESPEGAREISPWREPWDFAKGAKSPLGAEETPFSSAPTGLLRCVHAYPQLAQWANFWRPCRGFARNTYAG
jgi:hypothetical protein